MFPHKSALIIGLALVFSVSGWLTAQESLNPGVNKIYIKQRDGLNRYIIIEIPNDLSDSGHPVIFGFHGAGGGAQGYHRRLSKFVNQHGIISVSPLAAEGNNGITFWNFKERSRSNADDIELTRLILARLKSQNLVDEKRVYATGASSGGLMTWRLARETNLFAAIAPTKCGMAKGHEPVKGTSPISIMQIIGDQDKSYHGSKGAIAEMYSAKKRIQIWSKFNQCGPSNSQDLGDHWRVRSENSNGKQVELVVLKGVGHGLGREWAERTDQMIIEFLLKQSQDSRVKK